MANMTEEKREKEISANMEFIISRGYQDKYNHYGVYCIKVDNQIVYVGKSRNMLRRIAQHMTEIDYNDKKNMYIVLRELKNRHHSVAFDVITVSKDDDTMGFAEAFWIRQYNPILNIQRPHLDNYRKYDYVKLAKSITVEEMEKFLDNNK